MRYRSKLIPLARKQRPGYAMKGGRAQSITVHNTANHNATAANHADWLNRTDTSSSFHICVDDVEAVRLIPLGEQAWHTGTNAGNTTSIGIEVCEFTDRARQAAADANAQRLIADMLTGAAPTEFRTPWLALAHVRTHQSWMQYGTSGKYCPRLLLPKWSGFIAGIEKLMDKEDVVKEPVWVLVHARYPKAREIVKLAESLDCAVASRDTKSGTHTDIQTRIKVLSAMDDPAKRAEIIRAAGI